MANGNSTGNWFFLKTNTVGDSTYSSTVFGPNLDGDQSPNQDFYILTSDLKIRKISPLGFWHWEKTYTSDGDFNFTKLLATSDGGVLLIGTVKFESEDNNHGLAVKLNAAVAFVE